MVKREFRVKVTLEVSGENAELDSEDSVKQDVQQLMNNMARVGDAKVKFISVKEIFRDPS